MGRYVEANNLKFLMSTIMKLRLITIPKIELCSSRDQIVPCGTPAFALTSLSMHYVYLIRSLSHPNQIYIGNTVNLKQKLETHNSGGSVYTMPYSTWELVTFLGFKDKLKATAFEKYLKSGSGSSFDKTRFW